MSDTSVRMIGLGMLERAMDHRNAAQRRVWGLVDRIAEGRRNLSADEARLATEERALGEAQDMLRMIWEDFNPRSGKLLGRSLEAEPVDSR